jgi:hypothetical protein
MVDVAAWYALGLDGGEVLDGTPNEDASAASRSQAMAVQSWRGDEIILLSSSRVRKGRRKGGVIDEV